MANFLADVGRSTLGSDIKGLADFALQMRDRERAEQDRLRGMAIQDEVLRRQKAVALPEGLEKEANVADAMVKIGKAAPAPTLPSKESVTTAPFGTQTTFPSPSPMNITPGTPGAAIRATALENAKIEAKQNEELNKTWEWKEDPYIKDRFDAEGMAAIEQGMRGFGLMDATGRVTIAGRNKFLQAYGTNPDVHDAVNHMMQKTSSDRLNVAKQDVQKALKKMTDYPSEDNKQAYFEAKNAMEVANAKYTNQVENHVVSSEVIKQRKAIEEHAKSLGTTFEDYLVKYPELGVAFAVNDPKQIDAAIKDIQKSESTAKGTSIMGYTAEGHPVNGHGIDMVTNTLYEGPPLLPKTQAKKVEPLITNKYKNTMQVYVKEAKEKGFTDETEQMRYALAKMAEQDVKEKVSAARARRPLYSQVAGVPGLLVNLWENKYVLDGKEVSPQKMNEVRQSVSGFKALEASAKKLVVNKDFMEAFISNLDSQIDRVKNFIIPEIEGRVDATILNRPIKEIKNLAGSAEEKKLALYAAEISAEAARISGGNPQSIAELSQDARKKWESIIDGSLPFNQLMPLLDEIKQAGKIRMDSWDRQVESNSEKIGAAFNKAKTVPIKKDEGKKAGGWVFKSGKWVQE